MHPNVFSAEIFGHTLSVPTYGVLVALGFTLGAWLADREARRRWGADAPHARAVLDACFWALVGGLVGARVLFIVTNLPEYAQLCRGDGAPRSAWGALVDCTRVLRFWEGGIVYYGGFLGGLAGVALTARRRGVPLLRLADPLTPALAIGHFFGRLGCYAAGCCFGKPTGIDFGARFPPGSIAFSDLANEGAMGRRAHATPPLHPTQLYEAGGELLVFAALVWVRGRKRADGQVFLAYLVLYPVLRSLVELVRGDAARKFVVPGLVSTSQALSLLVMIGAAVLWLRLRAARPA
ncbi:MAG: prolipoprotein diacylglyceryl transferase [Myxococcota bacterium]